MRCTYDELADAVYLGLVDNTLIGESKTQIPVEGEGLDSMVVLDLDAEGCLLGIEIVGARGFLRDETLVGFDQRGR